MDRNASPSAVAVAVEHDAAHSRFLAVVDGRECVADYRLADGVMHLTHTGVPPPLEGRGIAAALIAAALSYAERHGLKVRPLCSYARGYMQRHPETLGLLA